MIADETKIISKATLQMWANFDLNWWSYLNIKLFNLGNLVNNKIGFGGPF